MISLFNLYIINISWEDDGKVRPAIVYEVDADDIYVFKITTKYDSKSNRIKEKLFMITEWEQSGLHKPSYIDTNKLIVLSKEVLRNKNPIGELTEIDLFNFKRFMNE